MSRFMTSVTIACAIVVLAAAATRAGDLEALTDQEYSGYVRDRMAALTGEAEAMERIRAKYRGQCDPASPSDSDASRACELLNAAHTRELEMRAEEHGLIDGLERRYGHVPAWARRAATTFGGLVTHPHAPAAAGPPL